MKKFLNNDKIMIKDKELKNYSIYDIYGRGLYIESLTVYDEDKYKGFITSFEFALYKHGTIFKYKGKTQKELVLLLSNLSKSKKVYSPYKKEIMVIFVKNLTQVKGFLQNYITDDRNEKYFQVFDTIEFRDISCWLDTEDNAVSIAQNANELINTVFIPEKFFYITPNQRPRKLIKRAMGDTVKFVRNNLMPQNEAEYIKDREALYAGVIFDTLREYTYRPKNGIDLMYIDLTSAYPYAMIYKKHPMEKLKSVNPKDYKKYNNDENYFTIGTYMLTYTNGDRKLQVYKMEYNNDEEITEVKTLCGRDLNTISKLCDRIEIKCLELRVAKVDYLPKEIIWVISDAYEKKQSLKGQGNAYELSKKVVNGISGDLSRKPMFNIDINGKILSDVATKEAFKKNYKKFLKDNCIFSMYWGISVLSIVREILVETAIKTNAIYGDTDGLFLYAYKENVDYINDYNNKVYKETIALDLIGLSGLGQFKVECKNIQKFKSFNIKTYAYCTKDKLTTRIAGMKRDAQNTIGMEVFDDGYELKYASMTVREIKGGKINYKDLESDGYYVEYQKNRLDARECLQLKLKTIKGKIVTY